MFYFRSLKRPGLTTTFMTALLILPIMIGCSPSQDAIELAVTQTLAARSTDTPVIVTVVYTKIAQVPVTREVTREVEVTCEVEITREIEVTREVEVTRIVERLVTPTSTNTPVNSPTPTNTPTVTPTPSNTPTPKPTSTPTATPNLAQTATVEAIGRLAAPKGDGFFTVGVEIAVGKWHSTGKGDGCYWARLDANQNLLANHFGIAGGTVTIRPSDFEVELNGCGTWEYVEHAEQVLRPDATDPKGDGFYTVGVEIAAGRWNSTGTGDGCYWARLDSKQDLLDNHFGSAGGTVTIRETDYEVEFNGCGIWEYLGP